MLIRGRRGRGPATLGGRAKALRRLARERAKATGGPLDVSAVLRELLDGALAARG